MRLLASLVLGFSMSTFALPIYYTFEGTIEGGGDSDGSTVLATSNFQIGLPVKYIFLRDGDRQGELLRASGRQVLSDEVFVNGTPHLDRFYTEMLLGPEYGSTDRREDMTDPWNRFYSPGVILNLNSSRTEYRLDRYYGDTFLNGGNEAAWVHISISGSIPRERIAVGTRASFYEEFQDENYRSSHYGGNLVVTNISDSNPLVPEPSSLLLMALGAVVLPVLTRRIRPKPSANN